MKYGKKLLLLLLLPASITLIPGTAPRLFLPPSVPPAAPDNSEAAGDPYEPDSGPATVPDTASSRTSYPQLITLSSNGAPAGQVDLVILGDGYTRQELLPGGKLETHARRFLSSFFSTAPFDRLRRNFNIFLIAAPSEASGADRDGQDTVNTRYNSAYNSHGIARLLTARNEARIRLDLRTAPACDLILLMVNHTRYGGSGSQLYFQGRTLPMPVIAAGSSSAVNIALHECGHSLAGLGDEYVQTSIASTYPLSGAADCPNIDTTDNLQQIKWRDFFRYPGSRPLIGAWEGAYYRAKGVFRPQQHCKMRTLDAPFCHICRKALVKAVYRICGKPFDRARYHRENPVRATAPAIP